MTNATETPTIIDAADLARRAQVADVTTQAQPLLQIDDLWKIFGPAEGKIDVHDRDALGRAEEGGSVTAVRGLSFDVYPGELFVVMGLSGSGKSTLLRCLLRLIEPTTGRILVRRPAETPAASPAGTVPAREGKSAGSGQSASYDDVTSLDNRGLIQFRRTRAAVVFQNYGLLPHRNVLENVAFGLKLRGVARPERENVAREMLARVGLEGWERRYPDELSGGMQQRVGIARALAQDPDLLLMDEPFSGLDPLIRREMQDELLRLQAGMHKTIVFVTHDLNEAIRLGDRMAVMRGGEFVQVDAPHEVVAHPADEYVARFVQDEREAVRLTADSEVQAVNHRGAYGGVRR